MDTVTVCAGEGCRPIGFTSALARYLGRFDSRVITVALTLLLLTFCLVLSFEASPLLAARTTD